MATEQFANNAQTTLNGAITSPTATSIAVSSASGFPSSAQFRILVDSELMLVTSGAGTTTWAVTRGIEGTTARTHANGATVTQVLTAGAIQNLDASSIATGQLAFARLPSLNAGAEADWSLTDDIPKTNSGGTNQFETVARFGGFVNPALNGLRLSYSNSLPVTTSDLSGSSCQILFWVPYIGDRYSVYDGSRWVEQKTGNTYLTLPLQQTLNCTYTTGSKTLTVVSGSTAQLVRGMSGGAGAIAGTIASITATTISMTVFPLANGTNQPVTFSFPRQRVRRLTRLERVSPQVQFGNALDPGRARHRADTIGYLDGVLVNTAAINGTDSNGIPANTGRYLGTIYINGLGSGEDSVANRLLWNFYNPVPRKMSVQAVFSSQSTATTSWAAYGGSTYAISFVQGYDRGVTAQAIGTTQCTGVGNNGYCGIGLNSATANNAQEVSGGGSNGSGIWPCVARYDGYPGAGYNYLQLVEICQNSSPNMNFYGTTVLSGIPLAGINGEVWA